MMCGTTTQSIRVEPEHPFDERTEWVLAGHSTESVDFFLS